MPNRDRDYDTEFREFVRSRIPETDYVAAIVAKDIITELEVADPDLLQGWYGQRTALVVTEYVQKMSVATRAASRYRDPRTLFREVAKEYEETRDARVLKVFDAEYVVDDTNRRRRVAELTAADCGYISAAYRRSAQTALLEAAFFKALRARLVKAKCTVAELFTPEEYERMRQGFMRANGDGAN